MCFEVPVNVEDQLGAFWAGALLQSAWVPVRVEATVHVGMSGFALVVSEMFSAPEPAGHV